MKDKRGISPIIATVLLIALVVVIGLIIFTWFRSMTKEAITKFDGQNIEMVCNDVQFEASYDGGILYISNKGNVPIYGMNIKLEGAGSHETGDIKDYLADWSGLSSGAIISGSLNAGSYTKMTLIPVLLGEDKDGNKKTEACKEANGVEVYF